MELNETEEPENPRIESEDGTRERITENEMDRATVCHVACNHAKTQFP